MTLPPTFALYANPIPHFSFATAAITPAEFSPWLFKQQQQQQKLGEIVTKYVKLCCGVVYYSWLGYACMWLFILVFVYVIFGNEYDLKQTTSYLQEIHIYVFKTNQNLIPQKLTN